MNTKTTDLIDSQAAEITARGFIIERQEKRIAELEELLNKRRWRDYAQEKPDYSQQVLAIRNNKIIYCAFVGDSFWYNNERIAVLYWIPLNEYPLPPTDQQGE